MPVRVEDIAVSIPPVAPAATASAVLHVFLSDPKLFAIPVVHDGAPLGQVTRVRLTEALAGPNGASIYADRAITHLMNDGPVMAEAGTPVALIAKLAADNSTSALTDGVIVLEEGRYIGLISPSALLIAVAQENAARARAMQSSKERVEQARTRAMQIARDKARFLAFLSHEIRTPLTGILGIADILQETDSHNDRRRLARTISESGHHLDRLLGDLLDLSRLEAGKLPVTREPFDLRYFAREAKDLWQSRIAEKRLDLKISVERSAAARIESDAMRIRQILFNLMSNALKFTERGYVSVKLQTIPLATGMKLQMSVADTGCGISDIDKARMFEAFEQARASTAQTHGGSGLGLSIAKALTARLDGTITLADNEGGGSVFTVTLPVRKAGPRLAVENQKKPRMRTLKLGRILLAEDHAASAMVISRALSAAGWQVEVVETAEAAMARAIATPFQAILADIHLPDDNGENVVRQLRSYSGPNQLSPILAITADISPERRNSCARAGFTSMIEKPIRPRALVARLADVLMDDAQKSSFKSAMKRA
jgi:signal transduction histidine kinase/CheY-like chemotaxis protein